MQPLYTDKRYGNFSSKNKRAIKSRKTLNCVLLRGRRHSENARCRVVPTPRRRHRQSSKPDMIRGRHRGGRGEGWRGAAGRDFRAAGVPRAEYPARHCGGGFVSSRPCHRLQRVARTDPQRTLQTPVSTNRGGLPRGGHRGDSKLVAPTPGVAGGGPREGVRNSVPSPQSLCRPKTAPKQQSLLIQQREKETPADTSREKVN